jgi:hypothetical protein
MCSLSLSTAFDDDQVWLSASCSGDLTIFEINGENNLRSQKALEKIADRLQHQTSTK